jgi:hypothetical protein
MILDPLLGVEGVGADLAAEVDLLLLAPRSRELRLSFLPFALVETSP